MLDYWRNEKKSVTLSQSTLEEDKWFLVVEVDPEITLYPVLTRQDLESLRKSIDLVLS